MQVLTGITAKVLRIGERLIRCIVTTWNRSVRALKQVKSTGKGSSSQFHARVMHLSSD